MSFFFLRAGLFCCCHFMISMNVFSCRDAIHSFVPFPPPSSLPVALCSSQEFNFSFRFLTLTVPGRIFDMSFHNLPCDLHLLLSFDDNGGIPWRVFWKILKLKWSQLTKLMVITKLQPRVGFQKWKGEKKIRMEKETSLFFFWSSVPRECSHKGVHDECGYECWMLLSYVCVGGGGGVKLWGRGKGKFKKKCEHLGTRNIENNQKR